MEVLKFTHTIQIVRWMGLKHKAYDFSAWKSISEAIKRRMEQEQEI
jgi:hypothetical protein